MPTLAGDVQAVLADEKVLFQNQEVAFVIAEDRYAAADAVELVEVEYEALPVIVDPFKAMAPDAPVLREDIKDKTEGAHGKRKHYNHIFTWEIGDKAATDAAFAKADVTIKELIVYQRVHPCPLETCQCVASFDKIKGELTLWGTFQAPHVIRTVALADLEDPRAQDPRHRAGHRRRLRQQGRRLSRLHLRDRRLDRDRAAGEMGRGPHREPVDHGLRARLPHDDGDRRHQGRQGHGAARLHASPTTAPSTPAPIRPNGRPVSSTSSPAPTISRSRMCAVDGVYTNKAPGGVAYRCSFRVTEAAYCIERAMDIMAQKLGMDPAEFRMKNLIRREQFPYTSALGWEYDSGDYHTAMDKAMDAVDYKALREEQKAKQAAFKRGETRELMGIGVAFFTEIVGAGPSRNCDILGIAMFDSAEIRIHPTGTVIAGSAPSRRARATRRPTPRSSRPSSALPADNITVEEGNTDTAPYGLGTYGSRSTPVSGAATAMAARKIKAKAQMIAAHLLEVHDDDLEWDVDRFRVKGNPERFKTMTELAWAAYNEVPPGMEPGLEAVNYYDPPNMTYPFGAYICVVDVDVDTGVVQGPPLLRARRLRHAHQPDDHRGPDPWRPDRGLRHRHGPGDPLRRGRQRDDGVAHGLLPADRGRDADTGRPTGRRRRRRTIRSAPRASARARMSAACRASPTRSTTPSMFLGSTHIAMPHDHWRTWTVAEKLGLHMR